MADEARVPEFDYRWRPLEPLSDSDRALSDPTLPAAVAAWHDAAANADPASVDRALQSLGRRWAIDTGIIEGLYYIHPANTARMVADGLRAGLISHNANGRPPEEIIETIQDHLDAYNWLFELAEDQRPISTSLTKQLHVLMTRTQEHCNAVTANGERVNLPFRHGQFRLDHTHTVRADGSLLEYCPPEQITVEMDRLLELHHQYRTEGVPPDVHAAWLHHRYILIHPFEDGNGRTARALASHVLIEAGWLPLTVTEPDRYPYLEALETANGGDLAPFVRFVGDMQRNSATHVREALDASPAPQPDGPEL